MKALVAVLLKNLVGLLVTEKMIIWALKFAASQTTNKIDDNVVEIVIAAYKNDSKAFQEAIEKTATSLKK